MSRLKGITVVLLDHRQTGVDAFNRPVYEDVEIPVDNVLVGTPSSDDISNELNLSGKQLAYTLGIPKGDDNNWENRTVKFFGKSFKTIGYPVQGIEDMIPLEWNKKVKVELYG